MSNTQLKARLYRACLLVLAAGLCGAALVYATAQEAPEGGENFVVVDGVAYPLPTQQTKRYVRTLEQFGGKGAVLFDEFGRWFAALWQGKALGVTLACLSTLVAAGLFLFAAWLPGESGERD